MPEKENCKRGGGEGTQDQKQPHPTPLKSIPYSTTAGGQVQNLLGAPTNHFSEGSYIQAIILGNMKREKEGFRNIPPMFTPLNCPPAC